METPILPSVLSNHSRGSGTCSAGQAILVSNIDVSLKSTAEDSLITSFGKVNIKEEPVEASIPRNGEALTAFDQLLMVCRQSAPVTLAEVFSAYCELGSIKKLGEGSYGEVFRAGRTVCEVVPFDGDLLVNGESQKTSEEILKEVLISLALNNLRADRGDDLKTNSCNGFIETKGFQVCQGPYDPSLISAWEDYDAKHGSENDHPKKFTREQMKQETSTPLQRAFQLQRALLLRRTAPTGGPYMLTSHPQAQHSQTSPTLSFPRPQHTRMRDSGDATAAPAPARLRATRHRCQAVRRLATTPAPPPPPPSTPPTQLPLSAPGVEPGHSLAAHLPPSTLEVASAVGGRMTSRDMEMALSPPPLPLRRTRLQDSSVDMRWPEHHYGRKH